MYNICKFSKVFRSVSRVVNLDEVFGPVSLNGSSSATNSTDILSLIGPSGVWGQAVVLSLGNGQLVCSTLMVSHILYVQWLGLWGFIFYLLTRSLLIASHICDFWPNSADLRRNYKFILGQWTRYKLCNIHQ